MCRLTSASACSMSWQDSARRLMWKESSKTEVLPTVLAVVYAPAALHRGCLQSIPLYTSAHFQPQRSPTPWQGSKPSIRRLIAWQWVCALCSCKVAH